MDNRWSSHIYKRAFSEEIPDKFNTLGMCASKKPGVNDFLSFYSIILKLGTKKELVIL